MASVEDGRGRVWRVSTPTFPESQTTRVCLDCGMEMTCGEEVIRLRPVGGEDRPWRTGVCAGCDGAHMWETVNDPAAAAAREHRRLIQRRTRELAREWGRVLRDLESVSTRARQAESITRYYATTQRGTQVPAARAITPTCEAAAQAVQAALLTVRIAVRAARRPE